MLQGPNFRDICHKEVFSNSVSEMTLKDHSRRDFLLVFCSVCKASRCKTCSRLSGTCAVFEWCEVWFSCDYSIITGGHVIVLSLMLSFILSFCKQDN